MQFIDIKAQHRAYRDQIESAISSVLEHGRFIMGPEVKQLETELAKFVGIEHCVGVASGTDSLEIALRALGIGPGDEVVTVPFTWISSAEVIAAVGATPVFVDIDPITYNIDAKLVEEAITGRTKAIIAVSLFGQMPDIGALKSIIGERGIHLIEDGAQSFGAQQCGKRSCSQATIGSTSFFPAKPFGCYGDGGALFTSDAKLSGLMKAIRSHGGEHRHHHTVVGMNGRLDTIQAAILLAKLPFFSEELERRIQIGQRYTDNLKDVCETPVIMEGNTHVYAQYTIRVSDREQFQEELKAQGIPTAVYYPRCLHQQPVFAGLGYSEGAFPEAEQAAKEVVSLPMHPFLTESDQDKVIKVVRDGLDQ